MFHTNNYLKLPENKAKTCFFNLSVHVSKSVNLDYLNQNTLSSAINYGINSISSVIFNVQIKDSLTK